MVFVTIKYKSLELLLFRTALKHTRMLKHLTGRSLIDSLVIPSTSIRAELATQLVWSAVKEPVSNWSGDVEDSAQLLLMSCCTYQALSVGYPATSAVSAATRMLQLSAQHQGTHAGSALEHLQAFKGWVASSQALRLAQRWDDDQLFQKVGSIVGSYSATTATTLVVTKLSEALCKEWP